MYITLKNGKRLRMPTDEEDAAITAAAMSDPDALPWTDEQLEAVRPLMRVGVRPVGKSKAPQPTSELTLQLDADLLESLRNTGKGWQMRIHEVLREAVQTGRV